MLPSIALVESVEMIRDGGSLAAVFQGTDGSSYWLFFKVNLQTLPSGESERINYATPVVVERKMGTEMEVSWPHAIILLNQMRPLIRENEHRKWLEIMEATAEGQGQVSSAIQRVFGQPIKK